MRPILIVLGLTMLCSCSTGKKAAQNYYYVEPFKEQEVVLSLNDDLTFQLQDLTGCNQFKFTGTYKRASDSALIFDSVKFQEVLSRSNPNKFFSIKSGDTAWIINRERVFIYNEPFKLTSGRHFNLQEIRYKKLEEFYVNLLGWKGFLKAFGNGGGKKEARKRLLDCQLPDINMR